jgi:hypothetical protein
MMAGEAEGNGKEHNGAGARRRSFVVTVTFFPETGQVVLGGECCTLELSKALFQMGADEAERQIVKARQSNLIRASLADIPFARGENG